MQLKKNWFQEDEINYPDVGEMVRWPIDLFD